MVWLAGATIADANDNFPGTTITGSTGSLTSSNTTATGQAGEPATYGGGGLDTMWYSWTAPSNGVLTVETCSATQTNFDTTLKTYTGTAVNALTTIASDDDSCAITTSSTLGSRNVMAVAAGTVYRIQVDGYASLTGNFRLSWSFVAGTGTVAGDDFPGITITGATGSQTGQTYLATGQSGEPTTYGGGSLNTIWYSWTAPATGTVTFQTCSATQTNFDTTLKAYTGSAVGALATIAQNDDACNATIGARASLVSFAVTSGSTYRIQVDGYASNTGDYLLSWNLVITGGAATVSKTASVSSISTPGTITYTITVTNIGSVQLPSPSISDVLTLDGSARSLTSGPTYVSGDTNGNGQIGTTEVWTWTASYAVTQADIDAGGVFQNVATFSSTPTGPIASNIALTSVVQSPSLSITKTADDTTDVIAGQVVTYSYVVTNTGNITIDNIAISDSHSGSGPAPVPSGETLTLDAAPASDSSDVTSNNGVWTTLAPGDQVTFTGTYTVLQTDVDLL
ncbi:MAG: hypothetical protein R3D34_01050 [Nitratireductor sp.]